MDWIPRRRLPSASPVTVIRSPNGPEAHFPHQTAAAPVLTSSTTSRLNVLNPSSEIVRTYLIRQVDDPVPAVAVRDRRMHFFG